MAENALRGALTPEFRWPEQKLVWLLRFLLGGLAAYSLVVEPQYTTRTLLFFSAVSGLLVSVGFAFIPTTRPRTLKAAEAATLVAFMLHVAGHAIGLYAAFEWYDNMLHFAVPFASVLILYALSQATRWIWSWRTVKPLEVGIYSFALAVTLGTLWEVLEFAMDQLFGTEEQNGLVDTMLDTIADVAGALLGAIVVAIATWYGRRHGHDKVSEEPKRPVPSTGPSRAERHA